MGCYILLILLATLQHTIAKDVESHFSYKVGRASSLPWLHPHLRLLEGQRGRRQASVPDTTDNLTSQLPHEASHPRSSVAPTSEVSSIPLPTTKFVSRTVATVVPVTIDNNNSPVPVIENSSLLAAPLRSTLQPTTPNFTIFEDDHRYYRSRSATAEEQAMFWIDEKTMYAASLHDTLSESYRSAATVKLSFAFTFYGHEVNQITIATGGFLYMSEFLHQWLTATQYIAPLMANFDTQLGNSSHIRYMDNGTVFVVWWENVYLQDNHEVGFFSFQVMLHKDGRIIFNYKQIPIDVELIPEDLHPVKVGISDAFVVTKQMFYLRQRTIYEYHRVEINMSQVLNNSAIIIFPLPTCSSLKTCEDCINMSSTVTAGFQCHWCPSLDKCSDGLDRNRQEWLESKCDQSYPDTADKCAASQNWSGSRMMLRTLAPSGGVSIATIVIITAVLVIVGAVGVWLVYAYKNPNSRSGLWLIEHRPNNLLERVRQARRGSRISSKYEVAMQPEAESFA